MRTLKREARVAFSPRAQPIWFRIVKWIVIIGVVRRARTQPLLWRWLLAATVAGLGLHMFYRVKTEGWTKPWGGWDDLAAVEPAQGS